MTDLIQFLRDSNCLVSCICGNVSYYAFLRDSNCLVSYICGNVPYYAFLQLGVWMGTTWLLWKLSELFGEGVGSCNESAPSGGGVVILLVTSCYWDVVNQGSNRPLGNKRCYLSLLCLFVALFYLPNFAWSVIYYGTDTQQHGIYLLTL